ncbi:MAG: HAMP domain-containing sensor histidine kinase [Flavobacteriales bacterium]
MYRPLLFLLAALVLASTAALLPERTADERLEKAAQLLQQRVNEAQARLAQRAEKWATSAAAGVPMERLWKESRNEDDLPGSDIIITRDHAPLLWTGRSTVDQATLDTSTSAHLVLADGIHLQAVARRGAITVHALQQIWRTPPFENRYLRRGFTEGFTSDNGILASTEAGLGPVVRDAQGNVAFRLQWNDEGEAASPQDTARGLLGALALLFILAAAWAACTRLAGTWPPIAAFSLSVIGLRLLTLSVPPLELLHGRPLFDPSLFAASFLLPSLGDLLIDVAVLLVVAAFVQRTLRSAAAPAHPAMAWGLSLVVLFTLGAWISTVLVALVRDSSVSLDLFHVQAFTPYSWTALFAIAFLLLAWVLSADALVRWSGRATGVRAALVMIAAAALVVALWNEALGQHDMVSALWPAPLLLVLLLIRREKALFLRGLVIVAGCALFTAHLLNRQTLKRVERDRAALIETASAYEDPVIEVLFREALAAMRTDPATLALADDSAAKCSAADLDRVIRQPFLTGYWDRYDLRLFLYDEYRALKCSTSPDAAPTWGQLRERFDQGVPTAGDADFRSVHRPGEDALYIGLADRLGGSVLCIELRPRLVPEGPGFPELLLADDHGLRARLGQYTRARYERGLLTESEGAYTYPLTWPPQGNKGEQRVIDRGYDLLAQGDPNGTVIVLGWKLPTWLDHLTTFSYLFTLFALLAALFRGAAPLLRDGRWPSMGLGGQLRAGILLFAALSLVLFAIGTQRLVSANYGQRSSKQLDERIRSVMAELRPTLRGEPALDASMTPYLDHLLSKLSNVFYTDLSLYAPNGLLLATSREQVFNTGLLGRRMDPQAYRRLAIDDASAYSHEESIGSARFRTSYMPLRNDQGKVLAYLAMPFFARQGEIEEERAAGYVAIVNLFTLLFLLSVVSATLIANWTTRPLQLLKRGLERIALGGRNEPIAYAGDDELGELVRVYNNKVEELRESAARLARSERESAWREMARQVAHEIKNPLTPMKLSVQHFQRTWSPDRPDAAERLARFSDGLVQQIDVLSRIAGEFSHFAQMPPPHETDLDLGEVAEAAVSLFASVPGARVTLERTGTFPVHADREHLLRVFNNLVKNALQSVPEGRPSEVRVRLHAEAGEARAEVRDNGAGIPADIRSRIFTPSFTTKSSGMGLGLALVQRMVEQAGGRVWFTSVEGEGTSFFLALPLAPAS